MSCQICRGETGFFNSRSCELGHNVHKKCLKEPKNNSLLTDCRYCVGLLLKNKENDGKKCIVCQTLNEIGVKRCKIYKNMCFTCQECYITKKHYSDCQICREKHSNSTSTCFKCNEIFPKALVYFPPRCKSHHFCRKCLNSNENNMKPCDSCKFYFFFLGKQFQQNEVMCNLCGKFPEGKIFKCQLNHCYCKFCLQYINPKLLEIHDRIKSCEFCQEKFTKFFKGEISGPNSIKQNSILENPEEPPEFALNDLGSEVENKGSKDFEENKFDLQNAVKKVDKKKKKGKKKKVNESLLTVNQFYMTKENCGTCNINPGIGFNCGHFNCKICLGREFVKDLMYIFALIESNFYDRIPKQFKFSCITPDCRQEIHIPSQMIIEKVKNDLEPNQLSMYYILSPYFDGIPMDINICACSNITLSSSFFKLFCTCQPR